MHDFPIYMKPYRFCQRPVPCAQVPLSQAQAWCHARGGLSHFDTSAKEAINVEDAFLEIARCALRQVCVSFRMRMGEAVNVDDTYVCVISYAYGGGCECGGCMCVCVCLPVKMPIPSGMSELHLILVIARCALSQVRVSFYWRTCKTYSSTI